MQLADAFIAELGQLGESVDVQFWRAVLVAEMMAEDGPMVVFEDGPECRGNGPDISDEAAPAEDPAPPVSVAPVSTVRLVRIVKAFAARRLKALPLLLALTTGCMDADTGAPDAGSVAVQLPLPSQPAF